MIMSSSKVCGEDLRHSEGSCENTPSYPDGKCGFHTDHDTEQDRDWKPNYQHGLYMNRSGYYESQPEEDQKWIDAVVESFLDEAPFGRDEIGKVEKLRSVAIDLHKKRRADEYIHKQGMAQTEDVGYHEEYGPIQETKENVLHITADRLSRESRMTLKDLNLIGNDDNSNAEEVGESLIEALSEDID